MYKCLDCKAVFEEPITKTYTSGEYGDATDFYCPYCGEEYFAEVDECPGCGGWKDVHEHVCISCHSYAKRKLAAFAKKFSEAIREEMDEILSVEPLLELADL